MTIANQPNSPLAGKTWWRRRNVVLIATGLVVVAWLLSGFYTVATDEQGVVTRFGEICRRGVKSGLHYALPWPIDRVYTPRTSEVRRIEVGFTTLGKKSPMNRRSDVLTGDENILKMMMVVQYKIRDPVAWLFKTDQPHWLVERAVESTMNGLVASCKVDDVLTTAKGAIQVESITIAQELLNSYDAGIVLLGGNLQVVDPPVPVMEAFKDVASAKKDSERKIDEAHEYAGRILPQARGTAQQFISQAQGNYADRTNQAKGNANRFLSLLAEYRQAMEVTRTRLYVESMERIFSKMNVVVLDHMDGENASKLTVVEQ